MGKKMTKEQQDEIIQGIKKTLLENNAELIDYDRYKTGSSLYHKGSRLPFKCQLYVSINPRINKFLIGIKLFTKNGKDQFKQTYDNLPFDMKGRYTEAVKYFGVQNEIEIGNELNEEKIKIINDSINFYKEYFKEFLDLKQ